MPDFSRFDGSDRTPRPIQHDTLQKLAAAWKDHDTFALILPTGAGKSGIARAIQLDTGADVLTPSNILVDQYAGDYTSVNFLKGKANYRCKSGMSCRDWQDCGFEPCPECPYSLAKERALGGQATFFNPISYYYHLISSRTQGANVLVVDEAHQLASMILMLTSKRLKRSDYKFSEKCCNERYLSVWLKDQIARLDRLCAVYHRGKDVEKLAKAKGEIETLALIKEGLDEDPQNYVVWLTKEAHETYLNVKPLFPPKFLVNRIIGKKKLILMSGTLFDHDVKALVRDRPYHKIEQNSPIPRKNRLIRYEPAAFKINYQTAPSDIVTEIEKHIPLEGNTIVHSTYSLSKKLAPLFKNPRLIFNDNTNKDDKLAEFKTKGGVFLASGCAEGIDLKGDLCRVNIIPKIPFPDLGDPAVQKRKALQDGNTWYALEALKVLIQAAGRSTRSQDDYSVVLILDPNFKRVFTQHKHHLPRYFVEAVEGL